MAVPARFFCNGDFIVTYSLLYKLERFELVASTYCHIANHRRTSVVERYLICVILRASAANFAGCTNLLRPDLCFFEVHLCRHLREFPHLSPFDTTIVLFAGELIEKQLAKLAPLAF